MSGLSRNHVVDESLLRAALDAGADACCLATTPQIRLLKAIKAVAEGATWLDPEISRVLLHPRGTPAGPHLSPRVHDRVSAAVSALRSGLV